MNSLRLSIFTIFFLPCCLTAQKEFKARVVDALSLRPIGHCVIKSSRSGETYLTNEEGYFIIPFRLPNDTLKFSHFQYDSKVKLLEGFASDTLITLHAELTDSQKYINTPLDSLKHIFLNAISIIRRKNLKSTKSNITYEFNAGSIYSEMTNIHLNTLTQGVKNLKFDYKNGKTALDGDLTNWIAGDQTVSWMYNLYMLLHSLTVSSKFFPINPCLVKNGLQIDSLWDLKLGPETTNSTIHLRFIPKLNDSLEKFNGDFWINTKNGFFEKISLDAKDMKNHPFGKSRDSGDIPKVDLKFDYTFSSANQDSSRLVFFSYSFSFAEKSQHFKNRDSSTVVLNKGLIHHYNYSQPFETSDSIYSISSMYFHILGTPYDELFWSYCNKIPNTYKQQQNLDKIINKGFQVNYQKPDYGRHLQIIWNKNKNLNLVSNVLSEKPVCDLHINIHFDAVQIGDSILFNTFTYLDLIKSKYNLKPSKEHFAFVNIQFDLAEIMRLNLEEKLLTINNISDMTKAWRLTLKDMNALLKRYIAETKSGKDMDYLRLWNDRVNARLNIDSFKIFGIKHKISKKNRDKLY